MNLWSEFDWVKNQTIKILQVIEFTFFANDFRIIFCDTRPFSCVAAQICPRCLKQTSLPGFQELVSAYFPGKNNA